MAKSPEHALQSAYVNWLKLQYPDMAFCASAGGIRSNARHGARMKQAGYVKGFPDMQILEPRNGHHGLFIEFKIHPNKPTYEQKRWLELLNSKGYKAVVCYSIENAIKLTTDYLDG